MTREELISLSSKIIKEKIQDESLRAILIDNVKRFVGEFKHNYNLESAKVFWSNEEKCLRFSWEGDKTGEFDFELDGGYSFFLSTPSTPWAVGGLPYFVEDNYFVLFMEEDECMD